MATYRVSTSSPQPPAKPHKRDVEAAALNDIELERSDLLEEVDQEEESFSFRDFNQPRATERQASPTEKNPYGETDRSFAPTQCSRKSTKDNF